MHKFHQRIVRYKETEAVAEKVLEMQEIVAETYIYNNEPDIVDADTAESNVGNWNDLVEQFSSRKS